MALTYSQLSSKKYYLDRENGGIYEQDGEDVSFLCWRNGVRSRVPVRDLPDGLDLLWCSDAKVWEFVTARDDSAECGPAWDGEN